MNKKLLFIKKQISAIREAGGSRMHIPTHLWQEIAQCSESQPLNEVCQFVGINPARARAKLKRLKVNQESLDAPFKLVQLPSSPIPIMELSMGNGTLIRVFSV